MPDSISIAVIQNNLVCQMQSNDYTRFFLNEQKPLPHWISGILPKS